MKRSVLLSIGLTAALMPATRLAADGGYFQLLGGTLMPSQTQQRVAMAFYQSADDGLDRVTYVVQSTYTGNAAEFAWVIPAPATPTEVVAEGAENLLAPLDGQTAPRFTIRQTSGGGHGVCGCAANGGNSLLTLGGSDLSDGTHVEAQGVAGIFEWAALTSTGGESLLTWLNTNGFAVPASAEGVLNGYIQNEWHFLALRIAQPEEVEPSPSGKIYIPPIRFTCQTSRSVYPMVISQVSAADPTEVIVYVLGAHRAEAANLANLLIDGDLLEYDPTTPSQTNYEALVDAAIAAHGGLGLVTEYAWELAYPPSDWASVLVEARQLTYLTRLRTIIARQNMAVDFEFRDAATDTDVASDFVIGMSSADAARAVGEPLAGLMVFALAGAAMKRHFR